MAKRVSTKKEESALLKALKFVGLAQQKDDNELAYKTHCRIIPGFIMAYDGLTSAGHLLEGVEFNACPNTHKTIAALEKIDATFSVALTEQGSMQIKSGKFSVKIPCLDERQLNNVFPDTQIAPLNNKFRDAMNIAGLFTKDGDAVIVNAAVVTRDKSLIGTNGKVIVEAFHGISMPPDLNIPGAFIKMLNRITYNIVGFGFSEGSFTVWYDNGSFIKTQLYQEKMPNFENVLKKTNGAPAIEVPIGFYDGLRAVMPHSATGLVHFGQDQLQSHKDDKFGAIFQCPGLFPGQAFDGKFMLVLEPVMNRVDFFSEIEIASFFGEKDGIHVRGALARIRNSY